MGAAFVSIDPESPDKPQIDHAASVLDQGGLVAFPTETVYGIAASASSAPGVERLRALKGRPSQQPFTVHIGRRTDCEEFVPHMTSLGRRLARKAWPGPLTIVFSVDDPTEAKAYARLSEAGVKAIYRSKSVGIRHPDHPIAAQLLKTTEKPVIATSANAGGKPAATDAHGIQEALSEKIDLILDGGPSRYQKGSTIVSISPTGYKLVRIGVLDQRMVEKLATVRILFVCTGNTCRSPMAEGFSKQMAAERIGCRLDELEDHGIIIQSAGTLGFSGGRASQEAIEVCREEGIDISSHTSQALTVDLVQPADYIFAMARHHLDMIRSIGPQGAEKAVLLFSGGDIEDPIGGTTEDYRRIAATIKDALGQRMNEVVL